MKAVIVAKSESRSDTYFIFRNNGDEVTIILNNNCTIKTSHLLSKIEMDFLRSEYPFFFKKTTNKNTEDE